MLITAASPKCICIIYETCHLIMWKRASLILNNMQLLEYFVQRPFSRFISGYEVYSVIFCCFKCLTVNHPLLLLDAVYCFRWDAHRPGQPSLANQIHRCISGVYATDKMQYCHKILRNINFLIDGFDNNCSILFNTV